MTDDLFTIAVPEEEMAPPDFTPLPSALYESTLQPGAQAGGELDGRKLSNDNGWLAIGLPFKGFTSVEGDATYPERAMVASFTIALPPGKEKAVAIGTRGVVSAAQACGLTEEVQTTDGKTAQKLTASSNEELIGQFNAMAGTECLVYVRTAFCKEKADGSHLKQDGTRWMDTEITSVRPKPSDA